MRLATSRSRAPAILAAILIVCEGSGLTSPRAADTTNTAFSELAQNTVKRMSGRFDRNRVPLEQLLVGYQVVKELAPSSKEVLKALEPIERKGYEAYVAGKRGVARRTVHRAFACLTGREWTERDEYSRSLALFTDTTVADPDRPLIARVGQLYPSSYKLGAVFRLKSGLLRVKPRAEPAPVGKIDEFECLSSDLIDEPFCFALDARGVEEGAYTLRVDVLEGDTLLRRLTTPLCLVRGLDEARVEVDRRLERISGHESAKATIRYPFEFALLVNLGSREARAYNFRAAIDKSMELLVALEEGRDPLFGAVGDNARHYRLEEANEIVPYRIYVPSDYDSQRAYPLIVILHGGGGNENTMLAHHSGGLMKLAEKHGYVVAAPLGYRPYGSYGRPSGVVRNPEMARIARLSEVDVMNVLELVREEYNIDAGRIFLMGFSMGGSGTWYLGAKYADIWAAIAPIGAGKPSPDGFSSKPLMAGAQPTPAVPYDFEALRDVPVFVCHGALDPRAPVENARAMVQRMKELSMTCEYFEKENAGHGGTIVPSFPKVVDFFNRVTSLP